VSSKQAPKSKLFVEERKRERERERERDGERKGGRRVFQFLLMLNFRNVVRQPHSLNLFCCVCAVHEITWKWKEAANEQTNKRTKREK
jgi:hypothetical protein